MDFQAIILVSTFVSAILDFLPVLPVYMYAALSVYHFWTSVCLKRWYVGLSVCLSVCLSVIRLSVSLVILFMLLFSKAVTPLSIFQSNSLSFILQVPLKFFILCFSLSNPLLLLLTHPPFPPSSFFLFLLYLPCPLPTLTFTLPYPFSSASPFFHLILFFKAHSQPEIIVIIIPLPYFLHLLSQLFLSLPLSLLLPLFSSHLILSSK